MWNTMEDEVEHRRVLLRLAAKGNAQARKELEQEYHTRDTRLYTCATGRICAEAGSAEPFNRGATDLVPPDGCRT